MDENYWRTYWSGKKIAGASWHTEAFHEQNAREHLFHIAGGQSLLDFGCGTGNVLRHYASAYDQCQGVDFSEAMLAVAAERLDRMGLATRVKLIQADDVTVWQKVSGPFDRIVSNEVIQYFTIEQLGNFIKAAKSNLKPRGKLAFFEVIDPWKHLLWSIGLFDGARPRILRALYLGILSAASRMARVVRGLPSVEIGYAFYPSVFRQLGQEHGLTPSFVLSMYYPYRYHIIFSRGDATLE